MAVTRIPVTGARVDVLATAGDGPYVTLSTHLDTVPPFIAPRRNDERSARSRRVRREGNRRGDARGRRAAACAGLSVAMLFVVGEEDDARRRARRRRVAFARRLPRASRWSNGEPTESTLALGTKGAMRVIRAHRAVEAAHSAYPHLGRSATRELVHLLAELDTLELPQDELLGETTVNIGSPRGRRGGQRRRAERRGAADGAHRRSVGRRVARASSGGSRAARSSSGVDGAR